MSRTTRDAKESTEIFVEYHHLNANSSNDDEPLLTAHVSMRNGSCVEEISPVK